jgi:Flp pilus assembly pilin Flp
MRLLTRLMAEESGADLIEYALLTVAIGMCAVLAFQAWNAAISGTYSNWNTNVNKLWDPEPKP